MLKMVLISLFFVCVRRRLSIRFLPLVSLSLFPTPAVIPLQLCTKTRGLCSSVQVEMKIFRMAFDTNFRILTENEHDSKEHYARGDFLSKVYQ